MSTIGEREAAAKARRETEAHIQQRRKWRDRRDMLIGAGIVVGGIAVVLGTIFGLVYLVTLAIRLAWGP